MAAIVLTTIQHLNKLILIHNQKEKKMESETLKGATKKYVSSTVLGGINAHKLSKNAMERLGVI